MNVYLIGYRCSGKTSLGRMLAEELGWTFVDTDSLVVAQTGREIAAIVKQDGWTHFRKLEQGCLLGVAARPHQVVATGGGIVLAPQNVQVMQTSGVVVWLKASPGIIRQRMQSDSKTERLRPALTDRNADDEIETVLRARIALYREARNIELDTDHEPVQILVRQLAAHLRPRIAPREKRPTS